MNNELIDSLEYYIETLNIKMKIENKSDNTISSYNVTYKTFLLFLSESRKNITLKSLKEEDIYLFFSYKSRNLQKQGDISTATANAILSHLKKLFKHIERNSDELYDFDRVFDDIKIKNIKSKPKGFTLKEQKNLIDYLENKMELSNKFIDVRNSILVKFMMCGGLRISEALSIKMESINEYGNDFYELEFIGKGRKERYTLIGKEFLEKELNWLNSSPSFDKSKEIALTENGKPLNRSSFWIIIDRVYKKIGVKQAGLHVLRHTFAKNLLNNGKSVSILQSMLGHSSLQTTSVYTNPTRDMIFLAMNKKT